jgi:hypothetical protein
MRVGSAFLKLAAVDPVGRANQIKSALVRCQGAAQAIVLVRRCRATAQVQRQNGFITAKNAAAAAENTTSHDSAAAGPGLVFEPFAMARARAPMTW